MRQSNVVMSPVRVGGVIDVRCPLLKPRAGGGAQVGEGEEPAGQLGGRRGDRRGRPAGGPDDPEGLGALAFSHPDERERPVVEGDQHVVALAGGDLQGVHGDRLDGEAVGGGHGQPVAAEGDAEHCRPGCVDQPDAGPLAGLGAEGLRCGGQTPVEQVEREVDAAGQPRRRVDGFDPGRRFGELGRHVVLPGSGLVPDLPGLDGRLVPDARAAGAQRGEDIVGSGTGAVDPVVEHDDELHVVVAGVGRSSMISGANRPRSRCSPTCGWNQ
jgi:hypothetical protein